MLHKSFTKAFIVAALLPGCVVLIARAQNAPETAVPASPAVAAPAAPAPATPVNTVATPVYARIVKIEPGEGMTRRVTIDRGALDGVVVGWKGRLRATSSGDKDARREGRFTGTAVVLSAEPHRATVEVTVTDPAPDGMAREGDTVMLRMRLPARGYESRLMRLARLSIGLTDRSGKHYFTYSDLHANDSEAYVKPLLQAMLEDIHETGKEFGDLEVLKATIPQGRYEGKTGRDVMVNATEADLISFFRFVDFFPGKYIGLDWKVTEVFATWVINAAPLGEEELAEIVTSSPTQAEAEARLRKHLAEIKENGVLEYWIMRAQDLARAKQFTQAEAVRVAVILAAPMTGEVEQTRWALFTEGYILDEQERYEEAEAAYTRSADAFRAVEKPAPNDFLGVAFSLNNRARIRYRNSRYADALADYQESQRWRDRAPQPQGSSLSGIADALEKLGRYAEAMAAYEKAQAEYRKADDTQELLRIEASMAGVAARLGRSAEATAAYRRIADIHAREGNEKSEADARIELGDHLWKLGENRAALAEYERVLALRKGLDDPKGIVAALSGIGKLRWNLGDYAAAKTAQAEALERARALGNRAAEAEAQREIADIDRQSGDYPAAAAGYRSAAEIYATLKNVAGEATALEGLGGTHSDRRDWPAAIAAYERAIALREASGAKSEWAAALAGRGWVLESRYDLDAALKDYEKALALRRETGAKADIAYSLLGVSNIYWRRQDYDRAQKLVDEAMTLAKEVDSRLLIAECHRTSGELARERYRYDVANRELNAALALYRAPEGGDRIRAGITAFTLAQIVESRGDLRGALQVYEGVLQASREVKDRAQETRTLAALVMLHRRLGETDRAQERQNAALALARELKDDYLLIQAYHNQATLLSDAGDQRAAAEEMEKAMSAAERLGARTIVADLYNTRGVFRFFQGDYDAADADFSRSLELGAAYAGPDWAVTVLSNRAELLSIRGDFDKAVASLDRAVTIGRGVGDQGSLAHLLWTRGKVLRERGEARLAQGDAAGAKKDFADALVALDEALAVNRRINWTGMTVYSLLERGAVLVAQARPADARAALEEARRLAEASRAPNLLWEIDYQRSRALEALNDLAGAETACRQSVQVIETLQKGLGGGDKAKENFLRSRIEVFERMAEILGRRNAEEKDPEVRRRRAEEALKYVSLARFQVTERIAQSVQRTGDAQLDQAARQYRETMQSKGKLETERAEAVSSGNLEKAQALSKLLANTEEKLVAQYVKLNDTDPDFAARLKFDPRRLLDSTDSLPDDVVLMVLFPGVDSLHVWLFNNAGFVAWQRVPVTREKLYEEIDKFQAGVDEVRRRVQAREAVGKGWGPAAEADAANPAWYRENIAAMRAARERLSDWLVKPVTEEITKAKTLLILPYGRLCYLPFEALAPVDEGASFLGETRQIAYFTNEAHLQKTLLQLDAAPTPESDVWVAFADPAGNATTMLEAAQQIGAFFPNREIHSSATKTASEEGVYKLRPDATILHFGTHGYLNSSNPNKTFLEMQAPAEGVRVVSLPVGGGTTEVEVDGSLTQLEVYPFLRKTVAGFKTRRLRLVTLAACDTARAQDNPEAEVLGLPDAFTMAGAPAVIASLWPVEVFATSDLMVDFYRRLAVDRRGKAEALREARGKLVQSGEYSHPYFWTSFILFGNWR